MMTPEQRAAAMQLLGGGQAQQAAQAVDPNARAAQLQAQEAAAMGQPMPQQAPQQQSVPPQQQSVPPQLIQRILMMLRGSGQ